MTVKGWLLPVRKGEKMKTDIKSKVARALMNQRVEDECFYLLHTNVFCLTAEGGVVPAELSLARMSLRKGVEEVYHVIIEPGALPNDLLEFFLVLTDCGDNSPGCPWVWLLGGGRESSVTGTSMGL